MIKKQWLQLRYVLGLGVLFIVLVKIGFFIDFIFHSGGNFRFPHVRGASPVANTVYSPFSQFNSPINFISANRGDTYCF